MSSTGGRNGCFEGAEAKRSEFRQEALTERCPSQMALRVLALALSLAATLTGTPSEEAHAERALSKQPERFLSG